MSESSHDSHGVLDERWLASTFPFVRDHVPATPARVIEIGCGPLGGFIPALRQDGYDAVGIDPEAPDGPGFQRTAFEYADLAQPADAVVACTSLHHIADLAEVVERIASVLVPAGVLIVVEWAWERFDETTARWCFARLGSGDDGAQPGWLDRHKDDWAASGQPWDAYLAAWTQTEGIHRGDAILGALQTRFDTLVLAEGPYVFADLDRTNPEDEQAAIDAGLIQPTGIRYVGQLRTTHSQ